MAGLELFGYEAKSIRDGNGSLRGAYITSRDGQLWLKGAYIPPFQKKNAPTDYDPHRERKLLITKKQAAELERKLNEAGLTLVPISLYNNKRYIKLDVALARGKKRHDKRETIKKRDVERDLQRTLKN